MKYPTILFFLACIITAANAQTTITGRVVSSDGKPQSEAWVLLLDNPNQSHIIGTITDEKGIYELEIWKGKYFLVTVSADYLSWNWQDLKIAEANMSIYTGTQVLTEKPYEFVIPVSGETNRYK